MREAMLSLIYGFGIKTEMSAAQRQEEQYKKRRLIK